VKVATTPIVMPSSLTGGLERFQAV
jgi:hypothetical protein